MLRSRLSLCDYCECAQGLTLKVEFLEGQCYGPRGHRLIQLLAPLLQHCGFCVDLKCVGKRYRYLFSLNLALGRASESEESLSEEIPPHKPPLVSPEVLYCKEVSA